MPTRRRPCPRVPRPRGRRPTRRPTRPSRRWARRRRRCRASSRPWRQGAAAAEAPPPRRADRRKIHQDPTPQLGKIYRFGDSFLASYFGLVGRSRTTAAIQPGKYYSISVATFRKTFSKPIYSTNLVRLWLHLRRR